MIDFLGIDRKEEELSQKNLDKSTTIQGKVMEAIEWWYAEHGHSPTVREIGERCGYTSSATVAVALDNLEEKGYIRRTVVARSVGRNIQLTNERWFF